MALSKKEFSRYIKDFNFRELFNDMGWNNDKTNQPVVVDDTTFHLKGMAEKSGFKILICEPTEKGTIPDYNIRKQIETKVTKLFQEHLIIFFDAKKQEQIWQLVVRQSGKPTKVSETRYHIEQDPELLFQRTAGIFFEMDEEENITIVDVTKRVRENFHQNNERVTRQFYDKFKREHSSFLTFIKGIDDKLNQDWYASLMLNRLMFCYFIQKKGFLDSNHNYLREKLLQCKAKKGKVKFYSFYRDFLLVLFHKGLNEPEQKKEIQIEIGRIPYLNGGLFDEHELEKTYKAIDIDDKAFERLFDFFDEYEWHLDTRKAASGKDINPDVIGYIFEKYINDRAQMGAYYTKEDITDYIGKNCIIPWLFDETARTYAKAFIPSGEIWKALMESGDTYIYPAVKHGLSETLPKEIATGINDVAKRTEWNRPAPESFALPTEIWREVVERRRRYAEVEEKIKGGAIININDLITYNLDIRQFAQHVIENTNDPEFLKAFYKALNSVTILDPTCGSGAFLFAAMNILEPLYAASIQRMEIFVKEAAKGKYKFFEQTLEYVNAPEHPNRDYFIYKSIILCNLYGVDIMKEAVEIAKLRLFLKLVATVEADYRKPNLGLEPLPDIDFNIRSGNTLIGFATEAELEKGLRYTLDGVAAAPAIEEKCDIVAKAFARYKEIQLSYGDDFKEFKKAKENLNKRLKELNKELNKLLHIQVEGLKYDHWLETHKPFHWFAEFYEIIHDRKGFDIIIGNPPYVEYSNVRKVYTVKGFETLECGNLYALVLERCTYLLESSGYLGMIVPMSLTSIRDYKKLRSHLKATYSGQWITNHSIRPTSLFTGISQRVSIVIGKKAKSTDAKIFTTNYLRNKLEPSFLFSQLEFEPAIFNSTFDYIIPKMGKEIERSILNKLQKSSKEIDMFISSSKHLMYIKDYGETYWIFPLSFIPYLTPVKSFKTLACKSDEQLKMLTAVYNSSLFYWFYSAISDCWHFGKWHMQNFNFNSNTLDDGIKSELIKCHDALVKSYKQNRITRFDKRINSDLYEYKVNKSKDLIDDIDDVLSKHYKLTEEEKDYVINYDIKYRMGKELENEE